MEQTVDFVMLMVPGLVLNQSVEVRLVELTILKITIDP